MWSVLGKTLSVGTTTAPTSAEAPFATPVTGYGNEPYNTSNYTPWDFYQIPLINLELTVLSMMNGTGFWSFATLGMINSSSSTDLAASDNTRSVQVVNTNTTANNAAWISFRSYATNGIATLQSGAKIIAVFTSRTTTVLTADLAFLTNNAGTIAERMRITGAWLVGIGTSVPTHTLTLGSTSTGIVAYNTADQTTNYERHNSFWSGNVYNQVLQTAWSGTNTREMRYGPTTTKYLSMSNSAASTFVFQHGTTTTTTWVQVAGTATHSSTVWIIFAIQPFINQTLTWWYTALLINPTETGTWSWAKNLILAQVWWTTKFWVDNTGKTTQEATMTAWGTAGDQTINKPTGSVNIAATWSSVVVTNSTVNANSIITCVIMTNDTTAIIKNVVPAAGSFTIRTTAAVTAETKIGFIVHN